MGGKNLAFKERMTKQKKVIMDVLNSTKTHPTADWVYLEAKKILPNISLGTVYRNLKILAENNKIQELTYGSGITRYDANISIHYHFVCNRCQHVFDLDDLATINNLEQQVAEKTGFKVEGHRLEFYGLCCDCLNRGEQ